MSNAAAIREIAVPGTVYNYKLLWKNLIILGYNSLVYVAVLVLYQISPFPNILLILPALVLVLVNGIMGELRWALSTCATETLVNYSNAMRLGFFVTPSYGIQQQRQRDPRDFRTPESLLLFCRARACATLRPSADISDLDRRPWNYGGRLGITLPIYAHWRRRIAFWV